MITVMMIALMMEALSSSETSVKPTGHKHNVPEDSLLQYANLLASYNHILDVLVPQNITMLP
jgi:hypothetical protein